MRYSDIAKVLNGSLIGADGDYFRASTDTRNLQPGDLFVALRGPNFDGHDFVEQAVSDGAQAVMTDHACNVNATQIVVNDTRIGFGALARYWRQQFALPVIAVTGSNGKTTVKEMLASILSRMGETLVTEGNLNNEIGVPRTLLRLRENHRYAVIEMGANHAKEIAYLTSLVLPDVGLITNAGPAHLEGFGSVEGVARAKGELFEHISNHGTAVINADDAFAPLWREISRHCRILEFGIEHTGVAVHGIWHPDLNRLLLQTAQGDSEIELPIPGIHNARNALAAAAAAAAVGAGPAEIKNGLESMRPVKGRLYPRNGIHGLQILDDTYNANPASLKAALEVVAAMSGEKWLVLGDMGELGPSGPELHAQIGAWAMQYGIGRLYGLGKLSQLAVNSFDGQGYAFNKVEDLIEALHAAAQEKAGYPVNVLIKGSRAMRMERVVAELLNSGEAASKPKAAVGK